MRITLLAGMLRECLAETRQADTQHQQHDVWSWRAALARHAILASFVKLPV